MDELPMAVGCALEEDGLRRQRERYRQAGRGARLLSRTRRRLIVELDARVDARLVEQTIAIERACCPFFTLAWEPATRQLSVSVSQGEHEPALDAIAFALALEAPTPSAPVDSPGAHTHRRASTARGWNAKHAY